MTRAALAVAFVSTGALGFNGAVASSALTGEEVYALVSAYPDWDSSLVSRIIFCEARNDPLAYNPAGPYLGLGQVLASHVEEPETLYDPVVNVAVMHRLWLSGGYGQWPVCQWN